METHGTVTTTTYTETLEDLKHRQLQLVAFSYEMQQILCNHTLRTLPAIQHTEILLRFLYDNALKEAQDLVNLGPYTSIFECLLGPYVDVIFTWIERVRVSIN